MQDHLEYQNRLAAAVDQARELIRGNDDREAMRIAAELVSDQTGVHPTNIQMQLHADA